MSVFLAIFPLTRVEKVQAFKKTYTFNAANKTKVLSVA